MDDVNIEVLSKKDRQLLLNFIDVEIAYSKTASTNIKNIKKLATYLNKNNIVLSSLDACVLMDESSKLYDIFNNAGSNINLLNDNGNISELITSFIDKKEDIDLDTVSINYSRFNKNDFDTVKYYIDEISKISVLTSLEEYDLYQKIQNGDINAYNELVRHNLRLVYKMACKKCSKLNSNFDDLVQDGNMGLMRAAEKFDASKGYKFSTYAVWWIKQSIDRGIANNGRLVRVPVHIYNKMQKSRMFTYQYLELYGYEPSDEELMRECNITENELSIIKKELDNIPISLDAPVQEESDSVLGDFIEDENFDDNLVENRMLHEYLISKIDDSNLTDRERDIIFMRNGVGYEKAYTLEEVAKVYGVTKERIRQIEAKTYRKLRYFYRRNGLSLHI